MSPHGFEPWTPASLRFNPVRYNPNGLLSYKSSALNQTELRAHI